MMKKQGFTLIELSIVLIIIGLIIGGILAGNELIKQAKSKAIINEINTYISVFGAFKLKYDALPGDMPNAKTFWPGSGNGNGDGKIDQTETITGNGAEKLRAWDHLSLAGMLQTLITYTGTYSATSIPKSQVTGTNSFDLGYIGPLYQIGQRNYFIMIPKTSSEETYNIDLKIDDGKADNGKLLALGPFPYVTGHCTNVDWYSGTGASYVIPDPNKYEDCRIFYILPF